MARRKKMRRKTKAAISHQKERDVGGYVKEDDKDYNYRPPGGVRTVRSRPSVGIIPSSHADPVKVLPKDIYAEPSTQPPQYRTPFYKHQIGNAAAKRKAYRSQLVGHYDKPINSSHYRERYKMRPLDHSRLDY